MPKKYEYKFVKLEPGWFKWPDHRKIIDEHAQQGWRLVTIFALSTWMSGGVTTSSELIFEREIEQ